MKKETELIQRSRLWMCNLECKIVRKGGNILEKIGQCQGVRIDKGETKELSKEKRKCHSQGQMKE